MPVCANTRHLNDYKIKIRKKEYELWLNLNL